MIRMKNLVENLETVIKDMELTIIEKHVDNFCTVIAVRHPTKGVFTVYTTETLVEIDDFFALKMFRTSKHIPFDSIPAGDSRSFISRYSDAVESSKDLKGTYNSSFCPSEFEFFVKCAG